MKLKTISKAIAGLALAAGVAGSAQAFSITAGNYKIIFDNYDSGTVYGSTPGIVCTDAATCDAAGLPAPGSMGSVNPSADTMGLMSVASITNLSNGQTQFTRGVDGYLTGIFGNLVDIWAQNTLGFGGVVTTTTYATGGTFAIYLNASDYDPTCGPTACGDMNALVYAPSITTGALYLGGNFVANGVATGASYTSTFNAATLSGGGAGYIDFTSGSALAQFDTGTVATATAGLYADAQLSDTYNAVFPNGVDNGWTVYSSGQVSGNAVPEPGSIALAGLSLVGLAALRRRKQQA